MNTESSVPECPTALPLPLPLPQPLDPDRAKAVLEAHGYRDFTRKSDPHWRDWHHLANALFGKRVQDVEGIRYSIHVYCYFQQPHEPAEYRGGLMIELVNNKPFMTFRQHHFLLDDESEIERWERNCALFWETMGCEYYERYHRDQLVVEAV